VTTGSPCQVEIRIRVPVANSTSITPDGTASGTTVTGENAGAARAGPHSFCGHRNNWLA
jgi:hypothetical protein